MKKALILAALILAPFLSQISMADSIYDSAQNYMDHALVEGCDWTLEQQNEWSDDKSHKATLGYSVKSEYDNITYICEHYIIYIDDRERETYAKWTTAIVQAPSCPPEGTLANGQPAFPDHKVLGTRDGQEYPDCFTPADLAEADNCEAKDSNGLYPSTFGENPTDPNTTCMKHEDDSVCPVKVQTSIESVSTGETYYFYAFDESKDPSSCYDVVGNLDTATGLDSEDPPTEECTDYNGLVLCNEITQNVCDANGNCDAGCGSVSFGDQSAFVCSGTDTDGDGLADYLDPDIDGDGIANDDDLDADGDGQDDPTYSNSGNADLSGIEGYLAQIAANTEGGTGGTGSSASASDIGESVAEELEDKLTELGDFSTDDFEASVDTKVQASNDAIDTFLEADESDLNNAFDQSEFENSYSTLKTILAPSGCSASFDVPFSSGSLNLCESATKAQPFLYVLFAVLTFIYCMRRIQSTARGQE